MKGLNVPTSLNNLKTKVDDLDVGELKTVPIGLKKLCDEVVKNTKFNTLKTKVNKLDKKLNKKMWLLSFTLIIATNIKKF